MELDAEKQLKRGLLDIILLNMLKNRDYYGYEFLKEIKRLSRVFGTLKEGTLYPRLYRLQDNGFVTCESKIDEGGARLRKVYAITPSGEEQLGKLLSIWHLLVSDMEKLLKEG